MPDSRCGLIGTVRYEIGERILPAIRTTPESLDLQELLAQIANAGCKAAAMEVSSHALAQERTRGIEWNVAVFTNLTQDHLDFHGTMENYFQSQGKLFTGLAGQKQKTKPVAIVNIDDRYGQQLLAGWIKAWLLLPMGWGRARISALQTIAPNSPEHRTNLTRAVRVTSFVFH
jgi:UDP-N-acetylmuramyl tripeptide synthase